MKKTNETRTLAITCTGSAMVDLEDLVPFQGAFKKLTKANFKRFRSQLMVVGISAAFTVWKDGGKLYLLDGHQRRETLLAMKLEGFKLGNVPVNFTTCRNKAEAKMKDLGGSFNFPDLDLDEVVADIKAAAKKKGKTKKASTLTHKCPSCGHRFSKES